MKKITSLPALVLLLIIVLSSNCSQSPEIPIDLAGLRSSGDDWTVRQDTIPQGGILRLHHDKWLMYFVHWRPLTDERKELSPEYVRNLMLNFWGADMPFTLGENVGETEITGHKAYFLDGTIYDGAIQSRFIVWNCPESGRQFIADCNINLRKGTPPELFELQDDITQSISCHGEAKAQDNPLLNHLYVSKKYNLSFGTPENWRTHEYPDSEWFPNGMTPTNGTLWTLLTDSEKYVELRWDDQRSEISPELFNRFIERIESDSVVSKTILKIRDVKVKGVVASGSCVRGEGTFTYELRAGDQEVIKPFRFKAFLWNRNRKTYFLLASLVSLDEFWGVPVDLSPSDETFNQFIQDEVLAYTPVFDMRCLE